MNYLLAVIQPVVSVETRNLNFHSILELDFVHQANLILFNDDLDTLIQLSSPKTIKWGGQLTLFLN